MTVTPDGLVLQLNHEQTKVAEKLQESQSEQVPPSPSLLSRVKQYWKLNLPKAYSRMSPKDFEQAVSQAERQIARLVSQGYSLSGANEVVYPSLYREPESEDQPEDVFS